MILKSMLKFCHFIKSFYFFNNFIFFYVIFFSIKRFRFVLWHNNFILRCFAGKNSCSTNDKIRFYYTCDSKCLEIGNKTFSSKHFFSFVLTFQLAILMSLPNLQVRSHLA